MMKSYHDKFLGGEVDSNIFYFLQGNVMKSACYFFELDNWHVGTA
jgi:hypothetical protein